MDHLTDSQLIAQAQGGLAPEQASAAAAHLQTCTACQQRLLSMESVWSQLGTWKLPQPPAGLEARILAALPAPPATRTSHSWMRSMRVAAALVLAAGLGHAAGRLAWRTETQPPPDPAAAAAALHLDDTDTAETLLAVLDAPEGAQP